MPKDWAGISPWAGVTCNAQDLRGVCPNAALSSGSRPDFLSSVLSSSQMYTGLVWERGGGNGI